MRRDAQAGLIKWAGLAGLAVFLLAAAAAHGQGIVATRHNLSVSGPGQVRAVGETQVCVFCHTPHGGRVEAPLWNRRDSTAAYIPYNSPTLRARPGQPTGASKLCLSCHDGTIALGELAGGAAVAMSGGATMPPGGGLIGTDLRDDHPISFDYYGSLAGAGGRLTAPATWDRRVRLDAGSMLQCTTCHNPHDDRWGRFLVMPNQESALCRQCHAQPGFALTPHATSSRGWTGQGRDPWPHTEYSDVRSNACLNCHRPHHAPGMEHLLADPIQAEACFACHDGSVAARDLASDFDKRSAHPVRHGEVSCSDCHNPHRARSEPAHAPAVMGVMEGVGGIDAAGMPVAEARYQYEVCFKCHAGDRGPRLGRIERQAPGTDLSRVFSTAAPSFHPVQGPGRNPDVPSLIPPLNEASMIYCTDCHGSDSDGAGGGAGPHGSNHEFLLRRPYQTGADVTETPTAYGLCYGCHSRQSILSGQSFPYHRLHVVDRRTPCSACHDPHGIDPAWGTTTANAHLINFDLSLARPEAAGGRLEYRSLGPRAGECYLTCHGVAHTPRSY